MDGAGRARNRTWARGWADEYPWWFGTEGYSLLALAVSGDYTVPRQTLRLLRSQSAKANGNGRILHEVTTNGGVSNPGNTQETALFIMVVGSWCNGAEI